MLERTNEIFTAGLTNTPLTKSAILFFRTENINSISQYTQLFQSLNISYHVENINGKYEILSNAEIETKIIKMVFRNYRSYKPKLHSQWKYLLWENDDYNIHNLNYVIKIYEKLDLPLYYHRTGNGYHFFSVKPIPKTDWQMVIPLLRDLNKKYPPVTLRIKANKYHGELEYFKDGKIIYNAIHSDTNVLKQCIDNQDITKLSQYYWIVYYKFKNKEIVV